MGTGNVGTTLQARFQVASWPQFLLFNAEVAFFQFVEAEAGNACIQVGHAYAERGRTLVRHVQNQTFYGRFSGLALAAVIEPQKAESQRRIHGGLRLLLCVHAQHGQRAASLAQQRSGVHGREAALQVHAGRKFV